jgi:Lrp/AsnC family transcriptional regulator for asnA, asnC and gidA
VPEGRLSVPTESGVTQVDETDVAIMTALQEDGRRPFTEIARSLGLSEGTVRQRVGRLQRLGIVQIVGVVNPSRLGMRRLVIGVQVRGRAVSGVEKAIREFPEVDYVAVSTGGYDMVLMAACRDDDHVLDLVSERLRKIAGVDGLAVITVIKETKDAYRYFGALSG